MVYGALPLEATTFVHRFSSLKNAQISYSSSRNACIDGVNNHSRQIFYCVKTGAVKKIYGGDFACEYTMFGSQSMACATASGICL